MLVFEERGKPEYPEKNLSEQSREPTTNSTHILRRVRESIPSHIGGKRVLSPLHHPLLPGSLIPGKIDLKINQSMKTLRQGYSGVAFSNASAPG